VRKILVQTHRFLPSVSVDLLFEIAVAVQQRHSAKVQIEVTGRLTVISGKYT
jgi:hypothetical protein